MFICSFVFSTMTDAKTKHSNTLWKQTILLQLLPLGTGIFNYMSKTCLFGGLLMYTLIYYDGQAVVVGNIF